MQIEEAMKSIHDIPYENTTLGTWLLGLWKQSDKTEFHTAYKKHDDIDLFFPLCFLRDLSEWSVVFTECKQKHILEERTLFWNPESIELGGI